jgi:hypothetical protein
MGSRLSLWRTAVAEEYGVLEARGPRRVAVGKTLLIAAACAILPLIGNVVASFVTTWTGKATWLAGPAIGVVAAMLTALIQAYGAASDKERPGPRATPYPTSRTPYPAARQRYPASWPPYPTARPRPRGIRLPVALVTALLVIGVGGLAITEGVRYAVGYISGNEPGTDQLVRPASASARGVALTVESVTYTAHFTRVGVAARNLTQETISLPLFGYCNFTGSNGTTLGADPFRSRWSDTLPPGVLQRGVIVFKGHLDPSIRLASFSFTQIFGPSGGSITVRHIELRPG